MGTQTTTRIPTILFVVILMQLKSFRCNTLQVSSYSKVASNGVDAAVDIARVHRAREGVVNADLIFPKVFNRSEAPTNTGRAIDSRPFKFPLNNNYHSQAANHRINSSPQIIYSRPVSSKKYAEDRFTPGEAYSFTYKKRNPGLKKESDREDGNAPPSFAKPVLPNNFNPSPSTNTYIPPPSPNTYIPPKDLYSFPPNIDSIYPPPGDPFKSPVYPGPISPDTLPPSDTSNDDNSVIKNNGDVMTNPMRDDGNGNGNADENSEGNAQNDDGNANDAPSMMDYNDGPQLSLQRPPPPTPPPPPPPFDDEHDHHHGHHDHPPYLNFGSSRPSALPFPFDPSVLKDDHDHFGHHGGEIIYDHDPHHDHFHDHDYFDFHHHLPPPRPLPPPPPPPPTTTESPPPPPPEPEEPEEQPRVKKYSYFYLSRSLWYIPLYFTVWFTFYVTWLILQSIGRHKVDLPNHITSRSIRDLSHKETVHKVNTLTQFVMTQIDDFKDKYL